MAQNTPDRIFRPKTDNMNLLIDQLIRYHILHGHIPKGSGWTAYVGWLINQDLAVVQAQANQRFKGAGR